MAQATRAFRVFVSSTFSDLEAERNALQERVFPRLRGLCAQHGTQFQAIDLRWGVSQETERDQRTMAICLEEIARCQRTSPRPNFLVLLGDRYGWRPLPAEIPVSEFEAISHHIDDADQRLVREWCVIDENAVPPVAALQPRHGKYKKYEAWRPIEERLRKILLRALAQVRTDFIQPAARFKYEASATEQEIVNGALAVSDAAEHVFAFFRAIERVEQAPDMTGVSNFIDLYERGCLDADAYQRVAQLKARLRERLGSGHVFEYLARWAPDGDGEPSGGVSTDHIDRLCDDVYVHLSRVIEKEIAALKQVTPLRQQHDAQRRFGEERARGFVGRAEVLARLTAYSLGASATHETSTKAGEETEGAVQPLIVVGASGVGKSALMARAVAQVRAARPDSRFVVVERYIGATPGSADVRTLLSGLCRELALAHGTEESTVTTDEQELAQNFLDLLSLSSSERSLVVFIDALDQLGGEGRSPNLSWLPTDLPAHTRLIVSVVADPPEFGLGLLRARFTSTNATFLDLDPMPPDEGRELLDAWLLEAGRTLQPTQRAAVLDAFALEGLPLYLKLAFEDARRWRSYAAVERLPMTIPGMIQRAFDWLSAPENHGALLVERGLGYLGAARNGLSEDELLDVLSADSDVLVDFKRRSPKSPPVDRLPVVVWSRLYFDLEPYLTERRAEGASLLTFYHRQLAEAVTAAFLTEQDGRGPELHRVLARYFAAQPLTTGGSRISSVDEAARKAGGVEKAFPNLRKLDELPYQQTRGELWDEAFQTLTDFSFLEWKVAGLGVLERTGTDGTVTKRYAGVHLLQDDYALALERMPAAGKEILRNKRITRLPPESERRTRLTSFERALRREANILVRQPELLWQQLYNRLQWERKAIDQQLVNELARRSAPGAAPWLHMCTPYPESTALIRTMSSEPYSIATLAFSPTGTLLYTGGDFNEITEWSTSTGQQRTLQTGGTLFEDITAIEVSPDGTSLVTGHKDNNLRMWDAQTGELRHILRGHKHDINDCAFSPDGTFVLSASHDETLKLWAAARGREIATLVNGDSGVTACAISPDGKVFVSGSQDNTFRLWDAHSRRVKKVLHRHTGEIKACTFSPDGSLVLSASADGTLKLWNVRSARNVKKLVGHDGAVTTCAFSPNGRIIVSGGVDRTVKLWDALTGRTRVTLHGHTATIDRCAFSPDGATVASCTFDTIKLWAADAEPNHKIYPVHGEAVKACAFSPDGGLVVSASMDHTLKLWDGDELNEQTILVGHTDRVEDCHWSPDGIEIVSASRDGVLAVWNVETGERLRVLKGHAGQVWGTAYSLDGSTIASISTDHTLGLWNAASGQRRAAISNQHTVKLICCAASPDGTAILTGGADAFLIRWDIANGSKLDAIDTRHSLGIWTCAYSPDGAMLLAGSQEGAISLWDADTGEESAELRGHTNRVSDCAFSPDGALLASVSTDGTLLVWDLESRGVCATMPLPGEAYCVAFHPRLPRLVSGGSGYLYLLDLVGVSLGPIIVTAVAKGSDLSVRCPVCRRELHVTDSQLGGVFDCTHSTCNGRIRANLFVVHV